MSAQFGFTGKKIIVTGASGGIGAEVAITGHAFDVNGGFFTG